MVAVRSSLRPLLRRVAEVIAGLLREKGYRREEVSLVGAWNDRTSRLYLGLFTSRPLDLDAQQSLYGDVMNKLREQLDEPGEPPVTWHIGLILGRAAEGGGAESPQFFVTEEEEDVADFLQGEMDAGWPSPGAPSSSPSKVGGAATS